MSVAFGWFCYCANRDGEEPYREPEGIVWLNGDPEVGQQFQLPSSKFKETWIIKSISKHDRSFTAVKK